MGSIAELEAKIRDCERRIENIEKVIDAIDGLFEYVDRCNNSVSEFSTYANKVIINKQHLDQDKMIDVTNELSTINENLNTIIKECEAKIGELNDTIAACQAQIAAILAAMENDENQNGRWI